MSRVRNVMLGLAIFAGTTVLPANTADASLFDCLCRVLYVPASYCVPTVAGAPTVATVATEAPCAPVIEQVPCVAPAVPTSVCTTSYIRRTYLEPCVSYVTQATLEAEPRFVRRYYWDPILCRYRTQLEPYTAFVKRYYQVPVTSYVVRSYLQPVATCTAPACPAPVCPAPACPAPNSTASQPTAAVKTQSITQTINDSRGTSSATADNSQKPAAESVWNRLEAEAVQPVSNRAELGERQQNPNAAMLETHSTKRV